MSTTQAQKIAVAGEAIYRERYQKELEQTSHGKFIAIDVNSGGSRFLPRFLGVWLIINGFAYPAMSFTGLLFPRYEDMVSNIAFPAQLGELAFVLWLVIKGAGPGPLNAAASSSAAA